MAEAAVPSEAPDAHAPRPKRRRWLRRLVLSLILVPILLVASAVLLLFTLPYIVSDERAREEITSRAGEALHAKVEIDKLHYHPLTGIELSGVRIGPPEGFTRDVLRVDRIAIRYDLSGIWERTIDVQEISIERPELVLETRGGRLNVSALFPSKPEPLEEKEKLSAPHKGALSPIALLLDKLFVREGAFEMAGEGPNIRVSGASLEAKGAIDPKRIDVHLLLGVGARPGVDNVMIELPVLSTKSRLSVTTSVAIAAAAYDGLRVQRAAARVSVGLDGEAKFADRLLPRVTLQAATQLEARPADDRLSVDALDSELNGAPLVHARLDIAGVHALLQEQLGAMVTEAIASSIGLAGKANEGLVSVAVSELNLPLTVLDPYVRCFRPDLEVKGRVAIAPLEVEGTVAEIIAGLPRKLHAGLILDGAGARLRSAALHLALIQGHAEIKRGESTPIELAGLIDANGVELGPRTIERAEIELHGGAERIARAAHDMDLDARVNLHGVSIAPLKIDRAEVSASIAGHDLLLDDRSADDPIATHARVKSEHLRVGTGTNAIAADDLSIELNASIDRLFSPERRPIAAKVDARVAHLTVPRASLSAHGARVHVDAEAADPRRARPFDVTAAIAIDLTSFSVPAVELQGAKIEIKADAPSWSERRIAPLSERPILLPEAVAMKLGVALPKIRVTAESLGEMETRLRLATDASMSFADQSASLRSLELDVADTIGVRAGGRSRNVLSSKRFVDAKVEVGPIDLEKAARLIPPKIMERVAGLRSSGTIAARVRASGTLPESLGRLDLERPPVSGAVEVELKGVSASLPAQSLEISGAEGAIKADVVEGRSELVAELGADRLARARAEIDRLKLRARAGLMGEVWRVAADAEASKLSTGERSREAVEGASVTVDAVYPKRGDVDLRRLDVRVPGSGVDLAVKGRLRRHAYGVLRPELDVSALLDFDRLRALAPEIGDAHGKIATHLGASSKVDSVLDLLGKLELDGFSYRAPTIAIKNATGRIPIQQSFVIGAPVMREEIAGAEGMLGDDLEARIGELAQDLSGFKVILDSQDILLSPPRTADYESLRPYYAANGPSLTIEEIDAGKQPLRAASFEGSWRSGVFRVEHMSAALWEGDVLGDLAFQVTADQNVRTRMRLTITDLNLDIPYAVAKRVAPVTNAAERDDYKVSGTMDLQFGFKERALSGTIDLIKFRKPSVERLFDLLLGDANPAKLQMARSDIAYVRPVGGHIWITRNLLSLTLDWERMIYEPKLEWNDRETAFEKFVAFLDIVPGFGLAVMSPTLGAYVMDSVNNSVRQVSIGNILEEKLADPRIDALFGFMTGRVTADPGRNVTSAPRAEHDL
jgi:hypothetical protein